LHTLTAAASHGIEVKHSRFVANAASAASPGDALAYLSKIGDPDATHNCWAYRIGQDYRSSDDGEPSGTAGRPILAAIDGQGFDQIIVVVTRWYGGINLGAGGLVRAYGGCAAECLRLAPRRLLVAMQEVLLRYAFGDSGEVHAALIAFSARKLEEIFDTEGARMRIQLPVDCVDALKTRLRDATRDRVRIVHEVS